MAQKKGLEALKALSGKTPEEQILRLHLVVNMLIITKVLGISVAELASLAAGFGG